MSNNRGLAYPLCQGDKHSRWKSSSACAPGKSKDHNFWLASLCNGVMMFLPGVQDEIYDGVDWELDLEVKIEGVLVIFYVFL